MVHAQIVRKRFRNRHSHSEVGDALYYGSVFCPLSEDFPIQGGMTYDGVTMNTAKHHFCYQLAKYSNDMAAAAAIANYYTTVSMACRIASRVRTDERWERECVDKLVEITMVKFADPTLRDFLLATGDKTIYRAVRHNRTNGIGVNEYFASRGAKHRGRNCFGRVLMLARKRLRADRDADRV